MWRACKIRVYLSIITTQIKLYQEFLEIILSCDRPSHIMTVMTEFAKGFSSETDIHQISSYNYG